MSADQLRQIREAIGFDKRAMARTLGLPYRTYQDYEYGRRGIPAEVADQAREAQRRDRQFMVQLRRRLARDVTRQYPGGIPSDTGNESEEVEHG